MSLFRHAALFLALLLPVVMRAEVLFVADASANKVVRISAAGTQTDYYTAPAEGTATAALMAASGGLPTPTPAAASLAGVAMDAERNLYVTDSGRGTVVKVPADGSAPVTLATGLDRPTGIAIGPDGLPYVAVSGTGQILKLIGPNERLLFTTLPSGAAPNGIAFGPDGTLYVAAPGVPKILQVPASGRVTVFSAEVQSARAVAVEADGSVVAVDVAGISNGRVVRFAASDPSHRATVVAQNLGDVQGIAVDRLGHYYVSLGTGEVKKVAANKEVTTFVEPLGAPRLLIAEAPRTRVLAHTGEPPASQGSPQFSTFSSPATGLSGHTAYQATLTAGLAGVTSTNDKSLWLSAPDGTQQLVAQQNSPQTGVNFAAFSDPVVNGAGGVAFRGKLNAVAGGAVAIWSNAGGSLKPVVREGDPAPGVPVVAGKPAPKFTALSQFALPDSGKVVFAATVAGADRTISGFAVFPALRFVTGQGRSVAADGSVAALVKFSDGTAAIVRIELV